MKLDIQNVSKKYNSNKYGLKEYTLNIENGILGLLGPNGAGKSTLLKMIATISKPSNGSILLNKNNVVKDPNYMRKQLGYLPQDFGVYPNLNAYEFLEYMAALKGIGGTQLKQRIAFLLEGLNLTEVAKKPIGNYSGGMKQRIGIAQALLNHPKILLFDEPTVGLDPEERVRFRNLISELANDCIVILSSHIVSDIDTIADQVAIMKEGQLLCQGNQKTIIDTVKNRVFEMTMNKEEVSNFKNHHIILNTIRKKEAVIVRYISDTLIESATPCEATLEDAYLYTTKK
ncbi:ABC-type multidrug transport system ATPase subunit [Aquimarina sp. EL_43]|uniref:ABC transporter ATP-binding protein n=1 Tax=unclassified Aquimarina TaxID=2627091 RepID=UPI0018CB9054|nr:MULTISPECIES: ABC transporter ATP-binding protein [unclassified Aquimarina]MBG6129644.1 ABC-type multidrug transport system ATPase subunit [Aquimarina sp. EL_35]MBG6150709.1 ABC-type multidrug transport system ATPase subunit [Aquimarina sp. EL_32]MBG6167984.1 ABC-type multidrug transport system ATPase subunit [Aquimarina sp. EL_43]